MLVSMIRTGGHQIARAQSDHSLELVLLSQGATTPGRTAKAGTFQAEKAQTSTFQTSTVQSDTVEAGTLRGGPSRRIATPGGQLIWQQLKASDPFLGQYSKQQLHHSQAVL